MKLYLLIALAKLGITLPNICPGCGKQKTLVHVMAKTTIIFGVVMDSEVIVCRDCRPTYVSAKWTEAKYN